MSRREDALSLELYIVLACLTGIVGVVLLALAVFPDQDLGMRVLRVLTGLLLLYAFQHSARVSLHRLRARASLRSRSDPVRLRQDILALLRAGRRIAAIRLYRDAMGVGLMEARRQVKRIAREEAPSPSRRGGRE